MGYAIAVVICFVVVIVILDFSRKRRAKKRIEKIRAEWGKPKNELFDFDKIQKYSDIVTETKFHRLTEQTLVDIDFYRLFEFVDRTTSRVGQQFLFKKLLEPTNEMSNNPESFIKLFSSDKQIREVIQLELSKLNGHGAYYVASLLIEKLLERPKWINFIFIDLLVVVCLAILSFKFHVLAVFLFFLATVNMFLHYWNKNNTFQFLKSFPQLENLISVAKAILRKGEPFYDDLVAKSVNELQSFQRKAFLINFNNNSGIQGELSQLGAYLSELIKGIFLIEVLALYRITHELENKKNAIRMIFDYIGYIDSSLSIASLRSGKETTCIPLFVHSAKELHVKNLFHPLVENCVKNSLSIKGKSILITGSNMSGKSTFLRTLAINSVLAQTIHTCFADEFTTPILKQYSSIRIDDSLMDGRSYYFEEVDVIASLLVRVNEPSQNLFVLDEVFRGTNTLERIASAKAILSYLNRGDNIVIVSTHDIELAGMLEHEYDLYHFTETVENSELHFDHTIKAGPLRTRNAIKILELSSYPADVVAEAKRISNDLTSKS